jgi:uncharacterized protein (DUF488 family)
MTVYTTGYTGKRHGELKPLVVRLGALLLDIRLSPRSRVPHWRGDALAQLLGERYRHVPALGNVNYKRKEDEPIRIADLEAGVSEILSLAPSPVLLLCGCADAAHCHRSVVAERLAALGVEVREIGDWAAAA